MFMCNFFIFIGLVTVSTGVLKSLYETSLIRLLGWSSMIHIGHIILSIGIGTAESYLASFFYLIVYLFLQLFSYIFILSFYVHEGGYIGYLDNISNIRYIYASSKWFTICFVSIILSMNGLPFFAGFFSKWYILVAVLETKGYVMAITLFLLNCIGLVYNLRLIRYLFMVEGDTLEMEKFIKLEGKPLIRLLLIMVVLLNMFFFLLHPYLYMYLKILILGI